MGSVQQLAEALREIAKLDLAHGEWTLAFYDPTPALWWMRFTKKGFGHVSAYRRFEDHWLYLDPTSYGLIACAIDSRDDLDALFRADGATLLTVKARPCRMGFWRPPIYCVSQIRYLVGVNTLAVTPWQLYRHLLREADHGALR